MKSINEPIFLYLNLQLHSIKSSHCSIHFGQYFDNAALIHNGRGHTCRQAQENLKKSLNRGAGHHQFIDYIVYIHFRSQYLSPRRLIHYKNFGIVKKPFCQSDLFLLSAAQSLGYIIMISINLQPFQIIGCIICLQGRI